MPDSVRFKRCLTLMKMLAVPLRRRLGSRCENMTRIGRPLRLVKLSRSRARVAARDDDRHDMTRALQGLRQVLCAGC